jgi:hypothetical protein
MLQGKWIAIFQLPIVAFGVAVGTNITQLLESIVSSAQLRPSHYNLHISG